MLLENIKIKQLYFQIKIDRCIMFFCKKSVDFSFLLINTYKKRLIPLYQLPKKMFQLFLTFFY